MCCYDGLFTERIMVSKGTLGSFDSSANFADSCAVVIAIYTKTGRKNSKHSWAQGITNFSSAATMHVQRFRLLLQSDDSGYRSVAIPAYGLGLSTDIFSQWRSSPCSLRSYDRWASACICSNSPGSVAERPFKSISKPRSPG